MTGFRVDSDAVSKIGDQQGRLAEDAHLARVYLGVETNIAAGEGLINVLFDGHRQIRSQTVNFFATLEDCTARPGGEAFQDAAKRYSEYDKGAAEKLDGMYPRSDPTKARKGLDDLDSSARPFVDLHEPVDRYKNPQDYNAQYPYTPNLMDAISPSSIYRDLVWGVTALAAHLGFLDRAYDPFESIVKVVSGDWAGFRACADVFDNVGLALGDMATNVQWTAQRLEQSWAGNAADSAQVYLFELAKSLNSAKDPFKELAGHYKEVAQGAYEVGDVVGGLLCDLIDAGIAFVAGAEAAGASAGTVVGIPAAVVIADATLMYELVKFVQILYKIFEIIDKAYTYMDRINAAVSGLGRVIVPENMPQLGPSKRMYLPR